MVRAVGSEEYNLRQIVQKDTKCVWKSSNGHLRIFEFKVNDGWVDFVALQWSGCKLGDGGTCWDTGKMTCKKLFEASVVTYDGVRHLEINRNGIDSDGYLYYPDMEDLIAALSYVKEVADRMEEGEDYE